MGTNLSQKALITEYQCHWIWAGRDDCFQIYNLQVCTLCATSVPQSTNVVWNPFESGLHIHFHCLGLSSQETFSECLSGDWSCIFHESCSNKCRNHRNFFHTQTLRRQKRFKTFGKTTPSHSLLSESSTFCTLLFVTLLSNLQRVSHVFPLPSEQTSNSQNLK